MARNTHELLRTFTKRLSRSEFDYMFRRLRDAYGQDYSDAVSFLEKNPDMDAWLRSARNFQDLFDMIDLVYESMQYDPRASDID